MTSSAGGSAFAFSHSSVQISGRSLVTADCLDSNGLTGCRATSVNGVVFVDLLLNGSVVIDGGVGFCDPASHSQCCGLDAACQTILSSTTTTTTTTTPSVDADPQTVGAAVVLAAIFGTLLVCIALAFAIYVYEVHLCFVAEVKKHDDEMHAKDDELQLEVAKEKAAETRAQIAEKKEAIAEKKEAVAEAKEASAERTVARFVAAGARGTTPGHHHKKKKKRRVAPAESTTSSSEGE